MQIDLTSINNIIFDLGKVLLNLDFDASIGAFKKLGLDREVLNRQQDYANPVFFGLETGQVTPEEFRDKVRKMLKRPELKNVQIDEAWCAMILEIPEKRVEVLQHLKRRYNLYLFSNTNRIHMNKFHARFQQKYGFELSSLFVKTFYSFEIKKRKPDPSSYDHVIRAAGIQPGETLFIDDLEKNTIAAAGLGLKTFWLKDGTEIADVLRGPI